MFITCNTAYSFNVAITLPEAYFCEYDVCSKCFWTFFGKLQRKQSMFLIIDEIIIIPHVGNDSRKSLLCKKNKRQLI